MRRGKKNEWQPGAEALFNLLARGIVCAQTLGEMNLADDFDPEAAEEVHSEVRRTLNESRSSWILWHNTYGPLNGKGRYWAAFGGVDGGLRRMLAAAQLTFYVARLVRVARDQEESEFLMMAAAIARKVFDENAVFTQACGSATNAQMGEVAEGSSSLEQEYRGMMTVYEDVERITSERNP